MSVSGGFVYVVGKDVNRVDVYTTAGVLQRQIIMPDGEYRGLSVNGSLMYVLDTDTNPDRVVIFNLNGNEQGSFSLPTGVYRGTSVSGSTIYVLDDSPTNESVLPYTTTGELVTALGQRVSGAWQRREFGIG